MASTVPAAKLKKASRAARRIMTSAPDCSTTVFDEFRIFMTPLLYFAFTISAAMIAAADTPKKAIRPEVRTVRSQRGALW